MTEKTYKEHLRSNGYVVRGNYALMFLPAEQLWVQKIIETQKNLACITVYRGSVSKMEGPYRYTDAGAEKVQKYLRELEAKRKEVLDAGKDSADKTTLPSADDILADIEFVGLNHIGDDVYYCNAWGVTDNYNADSALELDLGSDFELC